MPRSSARLRGFAATTVVGLFASLGVVGTATAAPGPPRVVGAASLDNTSIVVSFSERMSSDVLDRTNYRVTQEHVNPEAGTLRVVSAAFRGGDRTRVVLTTLSQAELLYRVTVIGGTDQDGEPLASPVTSSGVLVDPTSAVFHGTPPSAFIDSDGDGLADHVESRGWLVNVELVDGTTVERGVSSNPDVADTDGDGLDDAQEANLRLDPRQADTDDDQLDDDAEFNEIYSDALAQDTDGDGLDDSLEYHFFRTSPLLADTDGDQLEDGDEIVGNRDPRVSDLPRPEIEVGEVRLSLNVTFDETNAEERRTLDTKNVSSTLVQSDTLTFSRQDTINVEAHLDVGTRDGTDSGAPFVRGGASLGYTFQQSQESQRATERSYERSLTTDREATKGYVVERSVDGGSMQIALSLRNLSTLAYRVSNLQVTAFVQDPKDRTKLTPVATLLPDAEPDGGFTLGPLVVDRGPFIFSNTTIVPTLVDSLMANSSGLVFRVSNFDIVDEDDRNFAFTSQEIAERTSRVVIDFGGARSLRALVSGEEIDENQPGDQTELHRVATNHGRPIRDTNRDGRVDDDPRVIFDAEGAAIGVDVNGDGEVTTQSYSVAALDWSPDGTTLATAGDDGSIRLWSPVTGRVRTVLNGHTGPVAALDWSHDGTMLVSGGDDGTVRVWDVAAHTELARWDAHAPGVGAVAWSPDDASIASGGGESDVAVWDRAGTELHRWSNHRLAVTSVDWSPDGTRLASSARGGDVRLWDVELGTPRFRLGAHDGPVNAVGWSPDGSTLASAGDDGDVRLWDTASFTTYLKLTADESPVNTIAWSPDGAAIAAAGDSGPVRIWDSMTGTSGRTLEGHTGSIRDLAWSDDGSRIASTAADRRVMTWSAITDVRIRTITGLADDAYVPDTRVVFDEQGEQVGITLHEALAAIGLTRYDEDATPTSNLTFDERYASYSTRTLGGIERIVRIRGVANDEVAQKYWEVLTPLGVDTDADIGELVLTPASAVSLNFVQDLDGDGLTADVEYLLRTSDSPTLIEARPACGEIEDVPRGRDTDGDCLDDRFEALIGWTVSIPQQTYPVFSSPNRADSDFDASECVPDPSAVPPVGCPYDSSDTFAAPAAWDDADADGLRDPGEVTTSGVDDFVLDPIRRDTDRDGIDDADEINGFTIERLLDTIFRRTDPLRPDTDGDTFGDGFERAVGLDPTDPKDTDTDGDGLPDEIETAGWTITYEALSTAPNTPGAAIDVATASEARNPDTDGDGLSDLDEFLLRTDPASPDSDNDGISDEEELLGFTLPHPVGGDDVGIIRTAPLDADTDDDKRLDGAEAELVEVESARWIVRVLGEAPYRVYSHPLVADADFDGLVDGDEYAAGTDPGNGNTDGDRRADDVEFALRTNPLAVDLRVTVVARSMAVTPFDLEAYGLSVRTPSETGAAGLNPTSTDVFRATADRRTVGQVQVSSSGAYVAKVSFGYVDPASSQVLRTGESGDLLVGQSRTYDPGSFGVPEGATFWPILRAVAGNTASAAERFVYGRGARATARYSASGTTLGVGFAFGGLLGAIVLPQEVDVGQRSLTFGVAEGQRFSIEGTAQRSAGSTIVEFGGLEGLPAIRTDSTSGNTTTVRPVFSWDEIADKFIEDFEFAAGVDGVNVDLRFYFIVQ